MNRFGGEGTGICYDIAVLIFLDSALEGLVRILAAKSAVFRKQVLNIAARPSSFQQNHPSLIWKLYCLINRVSDSARFFAERGLSSMAFRLFVWTLGVGVYGTGCVITLTARTIPTGRIDLDESP